MACSDNMIDKYDLFQFEGDTCEECNCNVSPEGECLETDDCGYSPTECNTCGYSPCDQSC